jgi:hypothetical protein
MEISTSELNTSGIFGCFLPFWLLFGTFYHSLGTFGKGKKMLSLSVILKPTTGPKWKYPQVS